MTLVILILKVENKLAACIFFIWEILLGTVAVGIAAENEFAIQLLSAIGTGR